MSLDRVSNDYKFKQQDFQQVNLGENNEELSVFENIDVDNTNSDTVFSENSDSYQQIDMSDSELQTSSSESDLTQQLTNYLESLVLGYEEQFASVKENNGIIAKGWDWFKNKTGIGAGSDKVQEQINDLKKQIDELKKDSTKLYDVYKSVTGNELNDEELNNLINGQVDLSNSKIVESVSKYTQGQKQCTNVISGIASGLAIAGLIAAGIVAAPFTGGASIAASGALIGTAATGGTLASLLALGTAGTAAYMVPQIVDGVTEKDGYSFKEGMQDVANGVINSTFTAVGMGAGKAVGSILGKTASKTVAGLAASETTSLIIGDGIGIGNYLTEAAFNEDVDFSWSDLGKTAAISTASSIAAGGAAFGVSSSIRPVLTSGTTAQSQIIGRLVSAGITGGSAGGAAAAIGGGTNYLLTCAVNGQEVSFDEWLNASVENLGSASLTGFIGGMAFEAVHLAAGTPKPPGTVKSVKGTNEDGIKYTNYLDKDGNVLATDFSMSDIEKLSETINNNKQGFTQESTSLVEGKIYDNTTVRTIRFNYTQMPKTTFVGSPDGIVIARNYKSEAFLYDWADNSNYVKSKLINETQIPNPNMPKYSFVEPMQLTQGAEIPPENSLSPAQNGGAEISNLPNTEIIDFSLAQFADLAQEVNVQAQLPSVEAQAQGSIISSVNAAAAGAVSSGGNNPPQSFVFNAGVIPSIQAEQPTPEPQLPTPEVIEQRSAFLRANYPDIEEFSIPKLAELDNIQFERAGKLLDLGIKYYYIKDLAETEEIFSRAVELKNLGVSDPCIKDLAETEEIFSRAVELRNLGVTDYFIKNLVTTEEIFSKAVELRNLGITDYHIKDLVTTEEIFSRAVELAEAGVTKSDNITDICTSLDEEQLSAAVELAKAGVTKSNNIIDICTSIDNEQLSAAVELAKAGITKSYEIIDICTYLEGKQLQTAVESAKILNFPDSNSLIHFAVTIKSEQLPTVTKCINNKIDNISEIETICSLSEDQQTRYFMLKQEGLKGISAIAEYSKSEEITTQVLKILNNGIDESDIYNYFQIEEEINFINPNNTNESEIADIIYNYIKLIDLKSKFEQTGSLEEQLTNIDSMLSKLNKIDSVTLKKAINLIDISKNGVKFNIILENVNDFIRILFDETEYQELSTLAAKGINLDSAFRYLNIIHNMGNIEKLSLGEKVELCSVLNEIKLDFDKTAGVNDESKIIDYMILNINKAINQTIIPTDVSQEAQTAMMQGFFANNNTNLENTLAKTDFSQFGKEGLPLKYSRKEFLNDLSKTLEGLSETEQTDILKRLGITPAESGLEKGYDGIINVNTENLELDLTNPVEAKVYELANKFIRENEVITGDNALDEALNSLIQGMPEFINVIGKQQHATQALSVDAHILKVLQEAMSNKNYQGLTNTDKTILKLSIVLHDIAKSEGVVDKDHPLESALYARNILEKYSLPVSMRDRIFELIKNHHWLEGYNNGEINADYAATMFRHKDDFTIAKIMAESDLKGVSKSFYNAHKDALDKIDEIGNSQDKINQTGQIIFTSKVVKPDLIPTQEYNGQTYKVINFTELPEDFDLSQYGFAPDTTPNSLRLYVHMTDSISNLRTVNVLSDVAKGGFLCASYISLNNKSTYAGQTIGVSLEVENVNIANASRQNQRSGGGAEKNFKTLSDIITGNSYLSEHRKQIPEIIKDELYLTDDEYKLFYEQFAKLQYETQIKDDVEYTFGSKTFKGFEIKSAIRKANDSLLIAIKILSKHNESNLYNPKINAIVAKYNSLEELAAQYPDILSFAQEHNLPIYLLGE